jgi:propionate catabolism operon transcriptional regulator
VLAVAPELGRDGAPAFAPAPAPTLARRMETAKEVLARFGGQRDEAARYLDISRTTLWRRLRAGT